MDAFEPGLVPIYIYWAIFGMINHASSNNPEHQQEAIFGMWLLLIPLIILLGAVMVSDEADDLGAALIFIFITPAILILCFSLVFFNLKKAPNPVLPLHYVINK
tara:strand:+ start:63 stop:374 length:312 start_codon:yes stop_codon:yes gene_type:complete